TPDRVKPGASARSQQKFAQEGGEAKRRSRQSSGKLAPTRCSSPPLRLPVQSSCLLPGVPAIACCPAYPRSGEAGCFGTIAAEVCTGRRRGREKVATELREARADQMLLPASPSPCAIFLLAARRTRDCLLPGVPPIG